MRAPLLKIPQTNIRDELQGNDSAIDSRCKHANFFNGRRKHLWERQHHRCKTEYANKCDDLWSHVLFRLSASDGLYRIEL